MIRIDLEILRSTPEELRAIVDAMARSLEASEGWPSGNIKFLAKQEPEDDPDRGPGTWSFVTVTGLPRGASLYTEVKGERHGDLRLEAESHADAERLLVALREGFAARAGALTWIAPIAYPPEWARLRNESAAVLGVQEWVPTAFLFTEELIGFRFGYLFVHPGHDPASGRPWRTPALSEARHVLAIGPVPAGERASSVITRERSLPPVDAIVAACVGDGPATPQAERLLSGKGEALPYGLAPPGTTATCELWAAGPWRVRIGHWTMRGDARFQLAVQHVQGGDRALFASSELDMPSKALTVSALAPDGEEASAMVERLLDRIPSKPSPAR